MVQRFERNVKIQPMIPSLSPVTAGGQLSLAEQVALCARVGFAGLETDLRAAMQMGVEPARELFAANGVAPVSFGLPVEWRKDDDTFQHGLQALPTLAAFAQQLGISRCVTWVMPTGGQPVEEYSATTLERWTPIARILAEHNIWLGLEFLGPQQFRTKPEQVWFYDIAGGLKVADEVNSRAGTSNVGLLLDCWHWYASGGTLMDVASIPVEQIVHVHINDAPRGVALPDLVDNVRELPGATGEIDLTGFLKTLQALGYNGPVAVETFSERLNSLSPEEAAALASQHVRDAWLSAGLS
jgi:sugar phosphate isomerase/epimerase